MSFMFIVTCLCTHSKEGVFGELQKEHEGTENSITQNHSYDCGHARMIANGLHTS